VHVEVCTAVLTDDELKCCALCDVVHFIVARRYAIIVRHVPLCGSWLGVRLSVHIFYRNG